MSRDPRHSRETTTDTDRVVSGERHVQSHGFPLVGNDDPAPRAYFARWAKSHGWETQPFRYHPLPYHLLDVAACAQVIAEAKPSLVAAMAKVGGISVDDARRLYVLMACLHDIGKFAAAFQALDPGACEAAGSPFVADLPYNKRAGLGHVETGHWCWFDECACVFADVLGSGSDSKLPIVRLVGSAAFGHHGAPPRESPLADNPDLATRMMTADDVALARAFSLDAKALIFLDDQVALPSTEARAKRFSFLLAGAITVADALGSSSFFPFTAPALSLADYWSVALDKAADAVKHAGLTTSGTAADCSFGVLYPGMTPSPLQAFLSALPVDGQFMVVVEDIMGSGKTEAAFALAGRSLEAGLCDGVFMGLPTMTTADSQAQRQAESYRLLFDPGAAPSMTLAHSASSRSSLLADAGASSGRWLTDDRRRRLLADMCVGTIDQALLAAMPTKFAALRIFGLFSKVLILDEVHSFDGYTAALIEGLLALHGALGGSAILLSATLTAEMKTRFCAAFASSAGFPPVAPEAVSAPHYPLVTTVTANGAAAHPVGKAARAPRDRRVAFVRSEAEAEAAVIGAAIAGCCVTWIRNTVDQAICTARRLASIHPDVTCFHSRMAEGDRASRRKALLARFGKSSTPVERVGGIVLATSIIEQSLDLDFDLVVVDLRPMDGILQAFGRAIRHPRDERGHRLPDGERDRRPDRPMLVLAPDHEEVHAASWYSSLLGNAAFVHEDTALLWRTARALSEAGWVTYDNVRELVEDAASERIDAPAPPCLLPAETSALGKQIAKRGHGKRLSAGFGPSTGYVAEGGVWDDERIPTRDGEDTVEVVFVRLEGTKILPYDDDGWGSGILRLRVKDFVPGVLGDPSRVGTVMGYPGAYVVTITPGKGNSWAHHGSVVRSCSLGADFGLEWSG